LQRFDAMDLEKLTNILSENPELQCVSTTRVRCSLTGHEMPLNYDTVLRFVQGAKFQRVKRLHIQLQKHEQYFEDRGSYLYCKLTKRLLTKEGDVIEKHINGRRFRYFLNKAIAADENGNQMETNSDDADAPSEPPLIDDSDADDSEDIVLNGNFDDDDSTSSISSLRDVEATENCDLYPELAFSDSGGGGDSDYDFNAMDTDLDAEKATKRKVEGHSCETPAHKRRRC